MSAGVFISALEVRNDVGNLVARLTKLASRLYPSAEGSAAITEVRQIAEATR
jgi:hypothetical protein